MPATPLLRAAGRAAGPGVLDADDHEQAGDAGEAGVDAGAPVVLAATVKTKHDHGDQDVQVVRDRDRSDRRADRRREDGDRRVMPKEDERRAHDDDGDLDGVEALAADARPTIVAGTQRTASTTSSGLGLGLAVPTA